MDKILITGATGFIGSCLCNKLISGGYKVFATYRETSSFEKCASFKDKIKWILPSEINSVNVDHIIHLAWDGIDYLGRNDWNIQISNFNFSRDILGLAKTRNVKKVICLGSSAELGISAYGSVKVMTCNYMRNLFQGSDVGWYWLRSSTIFGENEDDNWVIPVVINKLLKGESVALTNCYEISSFLYIDDFVNRVLTILKTNENKSGIYNVSNYVSMPFRDLLIRIADLMGVTHSLLEFGVIPDRPRDKILDDFTESEFWEGFEYPDNSKELNTYLLKTIEYHNKKL
jgi:nucleoside-diphosphate-sugar epimerase